MAARPPQNDNDTPGVVEFGIAALAPYLEDDDVRFPISRTELVSATDDPEIPVDAAGRTVALSDICANVKATKFESQQELMNVLHPVFEDYRLRETGGVFGKLRSYLPF